MDKIKFEPVLHTIDGVPKGTLKVFVYWNLHKKCWSVRNTITGRVMWHANYVHMADCQFVVQKAGRERVLREKKKNVHAGVVGYLTNWVEIQNYRTYNNDFERKDSQRKWVLTRYNPYQADHFKTDTGARIDSAAFVYLGKDVPYFNNLPSKPTVHALL
jgi:hypothetical protein